MGCLLGISGLVLLSCQSKETVTDDAVKFRCHPVFEAAIEPVSSTDASKVYVDENLKVLWHADDRVSIFDRCTYNQQYAYQGETGTNAGTFSLVAGIGEVVGDDLPAVYAVYPYDEGTAIINSGMLSLTLPAVQSYAERSFGPGANTMVSVTGDNYLLFKNLGGYLVVKLYGEDVVVSKVVLKGNNGEKLAGEVSVLFPYGDIPVVEMNEDTSEEVTLKCVTPVPLSASADDYTEFWFVLPPIVFSQGFTITVYDANGWSFEQSTENPVTISRSHLTRMRPVEANQPMEILPANLIVNDEGIKTYPDGDENKSGRDNFIDTGVYTAWALIREMIANGTKSLSADQVRSLLMRNKPLLFGEYPNTFTDSYEVLEEGEAYMDFPTTHLDRFANNHGKMCFAVLLTVIKPVLQALGQKIGIVGVSREYGLPEVDYYYFAKENPDILLFSSASRLFAGWVSLFEENNYSNPIMELPNVWCVMSGLGNYTGEGTLHGYPIAVKYGDLENWGEGEFPRITSLEWGCGTDGVVGGFNNGFTYAADYDTGEYDGEGTTRYPDVQYKEDEMIWCDSSRILPFNDSQATSPATPAATGKFYLASLLNQLANPDITPAENRVLIRSLCLPQYVYAGEAFYMTGKRINPGAHADQFFSKIPETVSLSSEVLIPLSNGIYPNNLILGEGIRYGEKEGSYEDCKPSNYTRFIGKRQDLDPSELKKSGHKPGDTITLTEYLLCDQYGSATGNPDDAYKYIAKKDFILTLTE